MYNGLNEEEILMVNSTINSPEEFGKKIVAMILGRSLDSDGSEEIISTIFESNRTPYIDIQSKMRSVADSQDDFDWHAVGKSIIEILYDKTRSTGIWDEINLLDFGMQAFQYSGEKSVLFKMQCQFQLANFYSDQSGLSRKFELYEGLIQESEELMANASLEDPFYYYLTRALARLGGLTEEWKDRDSSRIIWNRLIKLTNEADEDITQLLDNNAAWLNDSTINEIQEVAEEDIFEKGRNRMNQIRITNPKVFERE